MFNIFNFTSPFNPKSPTIDSACKHLERLCFKMYPHKAEHRDQEALQYLSNPAALSNKATLEIIIKCLKLTTPGKDYDYGRVKGTQAIAIHAFRLISKHPEKFSNYAGHLLGVLNKENYKLISQALSALGPISLITWPKGLAATLDNLLQNENTRIDALKYCISYGASAQAELPDLVKSLSHLARKVLNYKNTNAELSLTLSALGTLAVIPNDLKEKVINNTSHTLNDLRDAALFALASIGTPVTHLIKQEIRSSFRLSQNIARAAVTAVRFDKEAREIVCEMLNNEHSSTLTVLQAIKESLPEIQTLFTAELTLLVLATDRYNAREIELAREILRANGQDTTTGDPKSSDDFFTFCGSDSLRALTGVV